MNVRCVPFSHYRVSKETSVALSVGGPSIKTIISMKFRRRWLLFQWTDILRNVDLLSPLFKIMKMYPKCPIQRNLVYQELVYVRILWTFITVRTWLMIWTRCSTLLSVWNVFHLRTVAGVSWTSIIRSHNSDIQHVNTYLAHTTKTIRNQQYSSAKLYLQYHIFD
jgi:hypothetical protein